MENSFRRKSIWVLHKPNPVNSHCSVKAEQKHSSGCFILSKVKVQAHLNDYQLLQSHIHNLETTTLRCLSQMQSSTWATFLWSYQLSVLGLTGGPGSPSPWGPGGPSCPWMPTSPCWVSQKNKFRDEVMHICFGDFSFRDDKPHLGSRKTNSCFSLNSRWPRKSPFSL